MKATVRIMPKAGVLDPQGRAIGRALTDLGFGGVAEVRQGKLIELEIDTDDPAAARAEIDAMCRGLLANPVMETYHIVIEGQQS